MRKLAQVIAITTLFMSGAAHAAPPPWTLSEKSGSVKVLRAGVSKVAISGGQLRAGDVIATGAKSQAVLVRGGEYVVVSPNSRLRISKPAKDGGVVQFFKEMGSALFRIDKKATPHFGVKTPYMAAVVKGTTFSVTVTDSGAAVQVTEGAVQVATLDGGATQLLSPGMIGVVEDGQRFRLSIQGAQTRVIDSPNAPAGSTQIPEPISEESLVEIASSSFEGAITAPVVEQGVSLSDVTNGLVQGSSVEQPLSRLASNSNGQGNATGRPNAFGVEQVISNSQSQRSNNGAGNGNGNGNDNNGGGDDGSKGGDDSNGGGNGNGNNGNGNGNGGSNGGGNGNNGGGNDGSNGGGDSNGGGNGNVNGNGNDGSNGGGNGNGNNNGNGGNGNGNGGGNGRGND